MTKNKQKFLISCKEATLISVKKAEINISFYDRIRLYMHLLICQYCRLFEKQNKFIEKIISGWQTNKKLTSEQKAVLKEEIIKAIK